MRVILAFRVEVLVLVYLEFLRKWADILTDAASLGTRERRWLYLYDTDLPQDTNIASEKNREVERDFGIM